MKDFVKSFIEANSVSSHTGVGKILFAHDVQRLCDKILEDNGSESAELKIESDKLKEQVSVLESAIKAAESAKPKVKRFIQLHLLSGGVILVRPYDIDSITHTKEGIKAAMNSGKVWDLDELKTLWLADKMKNVAAGETEIIAAKAVEIVSNQYKKD